MQDGRVVGIDYGTKRIGIAIADPLKMFSQPVGTFSAEQTIATLKTIERDEGLGLIVVGWPIEEDGTEGVATLRVQEFINRLKKHFPKAEFIKQDERYSSENARELIKGGMRPSLRTSGRGRIDTAAAGIILQNHLDET